MKKSVLALSFAFILVLATACGAGKTAQNPESAPTKPVAVATRASTAVEPTEAVEATEAPEATQAPASSAPTVASDEGTLSLESRAEGLDKLKSYRMKWVAQSSSTDSGTTKKTSWDWTEEFASDPPGLHWVWVTQDSDGKTSTMEMWQIGNTTYMLTGDPSQGGSCISISSEDQKNQLNKGIFSPSLLGAVSDAKFVGRDTVNDIPAKHYKYDNKSALLGGLGDVSGEVWVADEGGYVVKDVVTWTGGSGLFGAAAGGKGDGSWNWELSQVNQPISIKAPENCGGAASALPIMADATEKSTFGDLISYKSQGSTDAVAEFYKKAMPDAGWKLEGEPTAIEQMVQMSFAKADQKAQIIITPADKATQVMITVSK